jgi:hypothetical protein
MYVRCNDGEENRSFVQTYGSHTDGIDVFAVIYKSHALLAKPCNINTSVDASINLAKAAVVTREQTENKQTAMAPLANPEHPTTVAQI